MFCAMGSNAILLHSGPWPFPSGSDVPFGSLHGKEEMVGLDVVSLYKIIEKKLLLFCNCAQEKNGPISIN
jgi:hypothetical protein